MRAYTIERDRDRRRHAVLDEDFWAYTGHAPLLTVCWRVAGEHAGEWEHEHAGNCRKCAKGLQRLGMAPTGEREKVAA